MVRILLVDEQKVIREGLKVLLESETDIKIVAAVENTYAAIGKIEETNPDILFISVKLSEIEALDLTAIVSNKYPKIKIIIFSDLASEQHLIRSLQIGIKGYLLKDTPLQEIVEAIYAVDKGFTHIANTAYDLVVPQIAENIAQIELPAPEIALKDIAEKQEIPREPSIKSPPTKARYDEIARYELDDSSEAIGHRSTLQERSNVSQLNNGAKSPQLLLVPGQNESETAYSLPTKDANTNSEGLNRYFSVISAASLGLLAISIGVMSVIFTQTSPQVVIENAVINGETVSVSSPIKGKITKINYAKGTSVTEDSVVATIEPLFGDRYQPLTKQLQEQIDLKKQQQTVAQQSLDFLEISLQTLEQEQLNGSSRQLDILLKSLYFNQIQNQETALKTAKIREDSARTNYENLQQMDRENRSSETKSNEAQTDSALTEQSTLNSAKNSWDLARLAIEEINANLENARQEYGLLQEQMAGNRQQENTQVSQKINRLQQQINSQKTSLNLIQTELNNLQNKLISAITDAATEPSIAIKAPIAGAIYTQKYQQGEVVEINTAIATILDCNNLWVEATVDPQITTKINTQEPVLVTIADRNLSLEGKISLIESLNSDLAKNTDRAITTQVPPSLIEDNYSRVVVSVPSSVDLIDRQQFCSVGQAARLSFGKGSESLSSAKSSTDDRRSLLALGQLPVNWLSRILASK